MEERYHHCADMARCRNSESRVAAGEECFTGEVERGRRRACATKSTQTIMVEAKRTAEEKGVQRKEQRERRERLVNLGWRW
jgi:hypothetical protein